MGADFEANITALERIKEYVDIPQEADWKIDGTNLEDSWPDKGHIKFDNYGVKYREELEYVLKEITTEIMPGEKIGIIGRTGAGKSSLSLGLFRMLELNIGDICIDNINIKNDGNKIQRTYINDGYSYSRTNNKSYKNKFQYNITFF